MAVRKALQPFELLAIFLAVPSLMLGAVVLAVEMWPLPGPGENSMALAIPCGLGSVALFVLFLIVAALARLRWRLFVGIAVVWAAICLAVFASEQVAVARSSDPRPLLVKLTRADVLYSEGNQPLYFVADDKARSEYLGSWRIDPDVNPKQICVVGEAAMRCLADRLEHGGRSQGGADERVLSIDIVRTGMEEGGSVSRSQVLAFLDSLRECVDGPAWERIAELKAAIEAKGVEANEQK